MSTFHYRGPLTTRVLIHAVSPRYSFLSTEEFVNAIAPQGDLTKIGRSQFATLFPVADSTKRGLVSWDDFVIFQTILKRPDADYWIAFEYFDVYVVFHCLALSIFLSRRPRLVSPASFPSESLAPTLVVITVFKKI